MRSESVILLSALGVFLSDLRVKLLLNAEKRKGGRKVRGEV